MIEEILNKSEKIINKLAEVGLKYSATQEMTKLTCIKDCGKCCYNPEVYARPLELLPLAIDLNKKNKLEDTYERLQSYVHNSEKNEVCFFYHKIDEVRGYCTAYEFRPLLCRSFGAFVRKKANHKKELSVCKLIKIEKQTTFENVLTKMDEIPESFCTDLLANSFYQIDPELFLEKELQINNAALKIFEKVKFYADLSR